MCHQLIYPIFVYAALYPFIHPSIRPPTHPCLVSQPAKRGMRMPPGIRILVSLSASPSASASAEQTAVSQTHVRACVRSHSGFLFSFTRPFPRGACCAVLCSAPQRSVAS